MVYYSSKLWGKTKKVVGDMEAFVAPENFNTESQPLNIVTLIDNYDNVNKAYIFSFTSTIPTLFLFDSPGITYRWGETISGVDYAYDVVSGTAFTAGSTKRYVIVNSTSSSLRATIPNGGVWLYAREKVYSISSQYNNYLKYIHCQDLHSLTTIENGVFHNCIGLTGILNIPNSVTTIGNEAFRNCTGLTGIGTILGRPSIGSGAFNSISSISEWHILSSTAPSVQSDTWGNYAKPLHVKIGATGYNIQPFTNTAIFSSIIYDL